METTTIEVFDPFSLLALPSSHDKNENPQQRTRDQPGCMKNQYY